MYLKGSLLRIELWMAVCQNAKLILCALEIAQQYARFRYAEIAICLLQRFLLISEYGDFIWSEILVTEACMEIPLYLKL